MVYESSYQSGIKPFRHNPTRGNWASPHDFLYTCIGHAFKMDIVVVLPSLLFYELGILSVIPYFISLLVFIVPVVLIQSFLGQFSTSGLISVFRIAPLFKGMGYVSLAINLSTLMYYSIFAAIPMVFFFHSLRPTLPWSCEGTKSWSTPYMENITTLCNYNVADADNESYAMVHVPSINFFKSHLMSMNMDELQETSFSFSWSLLSCSVITWALVGYILCHRTETIGTVIRYSVIAAVSILFVCLIRFMFLPGAANGLSSFLYPSVDIESWMLAPTLLATTSFGPGWGTILSMASYNGFKTNISLYSWIMCTAQFLVLMMLGLVSFLVEFHYKEISSRDYFHNAENQWVAFLTIPSAIANMEFANLWSLLFFAMIIIGSVVLIVVLLFSVLTAVFDEFEGLRSRKREVTLAFVGVLAISSIYFCSNHGILLFVVLSKCAVLTQTCMNLLLLMVVLWVYGRERFQRDIEFMTSEKFHTWKVCMVRIVAPVLLLFILLFGLIVVMFEHQFIDRYMWVASIFVILLPWLFIPAYGVFTLFQTTGSLTVRLQRCVRPTDWYPANSEERQKYEEAMGNMEITHQLSEVQE